MIGGVASQVSGLAAVNYAYDTRGRLTGVTQGSGATLRSLVYGYGADGFVSTITCGAWPSVERHLP